MFLSASEGETKLVTLLTTNIIRRLARSFLQRKPIFDIVKPLIIQKGQKGQKFSKTKRFVFENFDGLCPF